MSYFIKHSVHSEADPQLNASEKYSITIDFRGTKFWGDLKKKPQIVLSGQNNVQLLILHFLYKKS